MCAPGAKVNAAKVEERPLHENTPAVGMLGSMVAVEGSRQGGPSPLQGRDPMTDQLGSFRGDET